VVHIKVTTKDAPEHALKGRQPRAINHTSDEPERGISAQTARRRGSTLLEVELDIRRCRILVFTILMLE